MKTLAFAFLLSLPLFGQSGYGGGYTAPNSGGGSGPTITCSTGLTCTPNPLSGVSTITNAVLPAGSAGAVQLSNVTSFAGDASKLFYASTALGVPVTPTLTIVGTPGATHCKFAVGAITKVGISISDWSVEATNCPDTLTAMNFVRVHSTALTGATDCVIIQGNQTLGLTSTWGFGMLYDNVSGFYITTPCGADFDDNGAYFGEGGFGHLPLSNSSAGQLSLLRVSSCSDINCNNRGESFGFGADASGQYSGAFGLFANAAGYTSAAMGWGAAAGSAGYNVALGGLSAALGNGSTALGSYAVACGDYGVSLGSFSGQYTTECKARTLIIGGAHDFSVNISAMYLGSIGSDANPFVIQGADVAGTNVAGSGVSLAGGQGTGTGVGGSVTIKVAPAGSTGAAQNALVDSIVVAPDHTVKVTGLKTTGAATGKKVVCVDTSTGILYASSTGTDCSN